jgi:hypothetical protein
MGNWQITIQGGFAWVFEKKDGKFSKVTVGSYRTREGVGIPHEMILLVPKALLIREQTTLPKTEIQGKFRFVLRGNVQLQEGTGGLTRVPPEPVDPKNPWDNFDRVYDANRYKGGAPVKVHPDWKKKFVSQMELRDGRLEVLEPKPPILYDIKKKESSDVKEKASLPGRIRYSANTVTEFVKFATADGNVVASPGGFDLVAECGCTEEPKAGDPIPGFEITFDLYEKHDPDLMWFPHFPKAPFVPLSTGGPLDPGLDCPPRSYEV